MESCSLLLSDNIKVEPASETDCVQGSAKEVLTEVQIFDNTDELILSGVKIEQPEVYVDYPDQDRSMESLSLLPNQNIKLEPASDTDGVHSSTKEILTEVQDFDQIESEIPASVKTEQSEVYVEHTGEDKKLYQSSQRYTSISKQKHSQLVMYGNIDVELVKQELSDVVCEDRSHRFSNRVDIASCSILQEMSEHSNTESRMTENDCKTLKLIEVNKKPSLTHENCHLKYVETSIKQTQISAKPIDVADGHASCILQRIQTGDTPHISDVCDPIVNEHTHLYKHMRTQTKEKPYKCEDCGASFITAGNMRRHKRTHTGEKPYQCDECVASFTQAAHLKCHKRTHTGEKPYKCGDCGYSFTQTSSLMHHKRTHTGDKPYTCDDCSAAFTHSGHLKCHKRIHTGEKPYKCDYCGLSFTSSGNLNKHKKTHTE